MAGVNIGAGNGRRAVNQEINMIPFIDLLMVTIAFLLITAVWVTHSRMNVDAQVPGPNQGDYTETTEKTLHVFAKSDAFVLAWKQGSTTVSETELPKGAIEVGDSVRYDELAKQIAKEWKLHGGHHDATDRKRDRAVLHTENGMPFREMVGVMDAIYQAKRKFDYDGKTDEVPAFHLAFASR